MAIRIFNNTASTNAQRLLGANNNRLAQSVERISSGIRINKASDDAAGLAVSEGLRSDIRALRQAVPPDAGGQLSEGSSRLVWIQFGNQNFAGFASRFLSS